MKERIIILSCLFCFVTCKSQEQQGVGVLQINKSIKDSFHFAKKLVDTTDGKPMLLEGFSAIIVPERMGDDEEGFNTGIKAGFEMPCQCAYKKDTLLVFSGLAWEGGFAYISKSSKTESANFLLMFGKNRRWKFENREYKNEIEIPSDSDKLIISKAFPLKTDQLLYGYFEINTQEFFETSEDVDNKQPQRHILKIYFSCMVFPEIL